MSSANAVQMPMDDSLGLREAFVAYRSRQWKQLWDIASRLAPLLLRTGRYGHLKRLLRWCYQGARDSGQSRTRQHYAEELAWVLQTKGDLIELIELCSENATLCGLEKNRSEEASWFQKAGVAATWQGRLQDADMYLSRCLDIRRDEGDERGEARALWGYARLAEAARHLDCAVERLERACYMHQRLGMPRIETECAWQDLDRLIVKRDDQEERGRHPDTKQLM